MPHVATFTYRVKYLVIGKSPMGNLWCDESTEQQFYGYDTLVNGRWEKRGGLKAEGYRVYIFQDQKTETETHLILLARNNCPRFAAWCYDTQRQGKWEKRYLGATGRQQPEQIEPVRNVAKSDLTQQRMF